MVVESVSIIKDKRKAIRLGKKFCPKIYQEWKSIFDCVTGFVIADPDVMIKMVMELIRRPKLPFLIQEDSEYYYAFYIIPHLFDWSDFPIGFVKDLDSHLFDSESMCFRIQKTNHKRIDVATCCHYKIKFASCDTFNIFIEAEGHGIHPYNKDKIDDSKMILVYNKKYQIENLDTMSTAQWTAIKGALAKQAKIPHEQAYESWLNDKNIDHKRGDMFLRPHVLFLLAEEKGLL